MSSTFQQEIESFKEKHIYPTIFETEKNEKSYPICRMWFEANRSFVFAYLHVLMQL